MDFWACFIKLQGEEIQKLTCLLDVYKFSFLYNRKRYKEEKDNQSARFAFRDERREFCRAELKVGGTRHPEVCCCCPTDVGNSCLSSDWTASPEPEIFWAENIIPLLECQVMLSISEWQKWVSLFEFSEMFAFGGSCTWTVFCSWFATSGFSFV